MNKALWLLVMCMVVVGLAGCVEDGAMMEKKPMMKKDMAAKDDKGMSGAKKSIRIQTKAQFMKYIVGKKVVGGGGETIFKADGTFSGQRGGRTYTGKWVMEGGYYCRRDLVFDGDPRKDACLTVDVLGDQVTFTRDKGHGKESHRTLE